MLLGQDGVNNFANWIKSSLLFGLQEKEGTIS